MKLNLTPLPGTVSALCALCLLSAAWATDLEGAFPSAPSNDDRYGGFPYVQGTKTGWFHIEVIDGRHWFVDPEGNAFISKGVTGVRSQSRGTDIENDAYRAISERKFGSEEAWGAAARERLRGWGINTAGAFSSDAVGKHMPYVVNLALAAHAFPEHESHSRGKHLSERTTPPKIPPAFHPDFRRRVRERLQLFETHFSNPMCVGFFTDNEFVRVPDGVSYVTFFLEWDPDRFETYRYGKRAAVDYLAAKYGTIDRFKSVYEVEAESFSDLAARATPCIIHDHAAARADSDEIAALIGEEYARTVNEEFRKVAPHHLNLGMRHTPKPDIVLQRMSAFADVVSLNIKPYTAPLAELRRIHLLTGRPILLSEYAMVSLASDGAGELDDRDADTVAFIERQKSKQLAPLLEDIYAMPFVIGTHYYKYVDYPPGQEYRQRLMERHVGLVDQADRPKEPFVSAFRNFHIGLEQRIVAGYSRRRFSELHPTAALVGHADGKVVPASGPLYVVEPASEAGTKLLLLFPIDGWSHIEKATLPIRVELPAPERDDWRAFRGTLDAALLGGWSPVDSAEELELLETDRGITTETVLLMRRSGLYGDFEPSFELSDAFAAALDAGAKYLAVKLKLGGADSAQEERAILTPGPMRVWTAP